MKRGSTLAGSVLDDWRRAARSPAIWTAVLVLLAAVGLAYILGWYAPSERARALAQWRSTLSTMGEDRQAAIEAWVGARLADARHVATFPSVLLLAAEPEQAAARSGDREAVTRRLTSLLDDLVGVGGYQSAYVLEARGQAVASSSNAASLPGPCAESAMTTVRTGAPSAGLEVHGVGAPLVAFIAPIHDGGGPADGGAVIGAIVLTTDARDWLFPLLARRPSTAASVESLLAERSGDDIEFLSPTRLGENAAGPRRVFAPGAAEAMQAALKGRLAVGEFRDYRGEPVLADTRRIHDTPWGLVVKIDTAEALAAARSEIREVVLIWVGLSVALAAGMLATWRSQRAGHRLALAESDRRFAAVLENANDAILLIGVDGRIRAVNRQTERLYGFGRDELEGMPVESLVAPAFSEDVRERMERVSSGGGLVFESVHRDKEGRSFPVEVSARAVDFGEERLQFAAIRDIRERKRTEEALRESEERFRTLVASIGEGMGVVDSRERFTFVNTAAERIFGVGPGGLFGRRLAEFVNPGTLERVRAEVSRRRDGASTTYEAEITAEDGAQRTLVVTASPLFAAQGAFRGTCGVFRDVTEERRLGEQLIRAQKMEAVGRLAGGIAHDFNNLFQAMLNLTQLLGAPGTGQERAGTIATELEQQVRRGSGLARQLLLFSRRETTKLERLDLNRVVHDARRLLERLLRENIALVLDLCSDELAVRGDRGQLEQILLNLAVNGSDAMPDGGRLTFATRAAGPEVVLEVGDTGHGIPEDVRGRIFEPFFSTKGADKGTGLGLSVVDGIVRQHGGRVEVESQAGRGSLFRIVLPGAPREPLAVPAALVEPNGARDGTRILLVEDEPSARAGMVEVLAMLGYHVQAVASGEEAGLLPAEPAFDVLLTDFLLPGISGVDLARGLRDRWPQLGVILMSGYTEDDLVRETVTAGQVRFLQKPFDIETLRRELAAVLGEPPLLLA